MLCVILLPKMGLQLAGNVALVLFAPLADYPSNSVGMSHREFCKISYIFCQYNGIPAWRHIYAMLTLT